MTDKEIIDSIIDLYTEARESKFPSSNINRARSHTVSSKVEDLMAYFFSSLIDAEIIIDKPFSIQLDGKRKTIYPDISIKEGSVIKTFFDIKMDLGWKRHDFAKYCIEKSKVIKSIRGEWVDFEGEKILIDDGLRYEIVIISNQNISANTLTKTLDKIVGTVGSQEVPIYFLTERVHPNKTDSQYAKDNIKINVADFNRLRERLRTI